MRRVEFVRKVIPDVQLVLVMRNPIDRVWAAARRILWKESDGKLQDVDESRFLDVFRDERVVSRSDYAAILDNWLSVFPAQKMYVAFFEDIVDRPQQLLKEIFEHIGVSADVNWDSFPFGQVINRNPDYPIPERFRALLEEMYRGKLEELHKRFGARVEAWLC